ELESSVHEKMGLRHAGATPGPKKMGYTSTPNSGRCHSILRGGVAPRHLRASVSYSRIQQFANGKFLGRLQYCFGAHRCDWPVLQSLLYSHLLSECLRAFRRFMRGDWLVVGFQ